MSAVVGSIWNMPNFHGELFSASPSNTPLLGMLGGLGLGENPVITANFEFPTSVEYDLASPGQNAVSEDASLEAPNPTRILREQVTNVVQIHHHAVRVSYKKQSNMGRMSGLNTAGVLPNVNDELAWQITQHLKQVANDVEFSFLQGAYNLSTNATHVDRTRGMVEACQLPGGTNEDASGAAVSTELINTFLLDMFDAGAMFEDVIFYVGGANKQKLSEIYGYAPADRNLGGVNINTLETDFGRIGIVASRYAPANTILAIELPVIAPVFQAVPGNGILFYEELAKVGASETGQIYGQIGFDHGPAFAHGRLYGLAT